MFSIFNSNEDAALFGFKGQLVAEIGVSDSYKLLCSLAEASAAQVGNAVLGDDVVDIVLAGGADCAGGENGLYLAEGAALCGAGEDNCRIALWSYSLSFINPETGKRMSFKVKPPREYPWTEFDTSLFPK